VGTERQVDIAAWLTSLGLGRYQQAFAEDDIDGAVLSRLTGENLKKMGIVSIGHRRKLLESIADLDAQPNIVPELRRHFHSLTQSTAAYRPPAIMPLGGWPMSGVGHRRSIGDARRPPEYRQ
jgi:hypothetical protein